MKKQPTERKSGAPVRCSDLVRPSSFYQKLLGTLTWLNPMKYYQSWQNSRAWNRYYKWYAETEQYRSEAKLRRAQEQSDLANQTARVRLRSCIEFASGQKMELKDVEVDIPFPYFNGARWPRPYGFACKRSGCLISVVNVGCPRVRTDPPGYTPGTKPGR
jgi:hypothetical protein